MLSKLIKKLKIASYYNFFCTFGTEKSQEKINLMRKT